MSELSPWALAQRKGLLAQRAPVVQARLRGKLAHDQARALEQAVRNLEREWLRLAEHEPLASIEIFQHHFFKACDLGLDATAIVVGWNAARTWPFCRCSRCAAARSALR